MSKKPRPSTTDHPPTGPELLPEARTITRVGVDDGAVRDRVALAASLLAGLAKPPGGPSLVHVAVKGGSSAVVPLGEELTVGRDAACGLSLAGDKGLSRIHFRVFRHGAYWLLEDLGSRNGTWVDGINAAVKRRILRDGDLIHAGDAVLLFMDSEN